MSTATMRAHRSGPWCDKYSGAEVCDAIVPVESLLKFRHHIKQSNPKIASQRVGGATKCGIRHPECLQPIGHILVQEIYGQHSITL
jgi:hypothetical protein